jgi:putative oxidoreductase
MDRRQFHDAGLFLIRAMVGVVFVFHGAQKLFGIWGGHGLEGFTGFLTQLQVPMPAVSAVLAAVAEFGGGLLLIAGLATRLAAVPLVITMMVAAFKVHGQAFALPTGMEYALTLGVVTLGLALTGPGGLSLDALLGPRLVPALAQKSELPRAVPQ